jgi:large repetitive protein
VTCIGGYAKPSWQTGTGVPQDGVRDIPDLSLNASPDDDGYLLCFDGSCQTQVLNGQTVLTQWAAVGGTSASTPTMAGIMALLEQKDGAYQGQANYVFYQLAAMDTLSSCNSSTVTTPTVLGSCNFNDITTGSNSDPGLPGYGTSTAEWSAGTGYDMATGLGTVNAANMVANWTNVTSIASTTTLTTAATTLSHGQPLNINIHVAASSGTAIPTGTVALVTDKYGSAGVVTLDATGSFSGPVTNLPGGTYNLTARYGGNGTLSSSISAPVSLTVGKEDSAVTVDYDITPGFSSVQVPYTGALQYANPFYVNVKVTGKSGQGLGTGTVNILNGSTVVSSAPLTSSGTVTILTGSTAAYTFPVGTSTVSVQYLGDNSFSAGTSATQQISIQQQQIQTSVGISAYNVPAGQPASFTANIQPGYSTVIPTGSFQFYDNGQPLGSPIAIVPNNGHAYATVSYLATLTTLGGHFITAGYSGDANFTAVSGTDPNNAYSSYFMIVPSAGAATATSITQSPTTVAFNQLFTYAVQVTPVTPVTKGGPVPTGQVSIAGDGNVFGNITLINGQGSTIIQTGPGTTHVYAQYQGDSNYASSTSPVITTTVGKYTPPMSLTTTAQYVLTGQQTSLNAVVTGFSYGQYGTLNPTGTVQFFTSVNGAAPQAIGPPTGLLATPIPMNAGISIRAVLPTGTNVVTAVYSGDQSFNAVTSTSVTSLYRLRTSPLARLRHR